MRLRPHNQGPRGRTGHRGHRGVPGRRRATMKRRAQTDLACLLQSCSRWPHVYPHSLGERGHLSVAPEEHMIAKAFVVAMAADIARSDYAKPTLIRSRSREWLIACRWGPDGEYLSIATAGAMPEPC